MYFEFVKNKSILPGSSDQQKILQNVDIITKDFAIRFSAHYEAVSAGKTQLTVNSTYNVLGDPKENMDT